MLNRRRVSALLSLVVGGWVATLSPETASAAPPDSNEAESESSESNASAPEYELRDIVVRAKTNRDLVEEFEAKRDKAEWQQYRVKWGAFPEIKSRTTIAPVPADAEPSRFQENTDEIGNLEIGPAIDQKVELVTPVYTFGRVGILRELANLGVDVADLKRREAILNVVYQTKRAFYGLQLSRLFDRLLREGDARVQKQLEKMEEARQFGTADFETKDFRKLEIFAAEVDQRRADNEKLGRIASAGLRYLADLEDDRLQVGELDQDRPLPDLHDREVYLEVARHHRPELKQLDRAIRAKRLRADLERKEFYPNVFVALGIGFSWSTEETALQPVCRRNERGGTCETTGDGEETGLFARPYRDPLNGFSFNVGAGLRWKFDFFNQYGKLQAKRAEVRALEAQKRRAVGAMRLEIKKTYAEASNLHEKVEINRRRLEAARRWRDQVGFAIDKMEAKEVKDAIDPLRAFYKAKAKYLRARYDYLVARASLAQKVGVEWLTQVQADGTIRVGPLIGANSGSTSDGDSDARSSSE